MKGRSGSEPQVIEDLMTNATSAIQDEDLFVREVVLTMTDAARHLGLVPDLKPGGSFAHCCATLS